MAKIKYDVSSEDAEKNGTVRVYETPPTGLYPAKIKTAAAEAPADKNERLHVVIELTKPAKNNYPPLHEYITFTPASLWKLDQFLQAVGIASKTKRQGEFDDSKLAGKTLQVLISHETDTYEGQTRTRARIANFLPKDAKLPGNNGPAAASEDEPDDEVDLDALGAAADEGDEDAQAALTDLAEAKDIDPEDYETWAEVATLVAGEESEEEEAGDDEEGPDLEALGEAADADDEDAQAALTDLAEPYGIDPEEIETWAEVAAAIAEAQEGGEEGAEEIPDYESLGIMALKKLAKERGIPSGGTKEELIERHQEFDGTDPFED